MSLMPHHTSDAMCALCEQKLLTAIVDMRDWFHAVKLKYPNVHVSWAYRDEQSQNQAVADGKSNLRYPNSPHNRMSATDQPESLALDLFQIDDDGVALFSPKFYSALNDDNEAQKLPIFWGGRFRSLGDFDHFQFILTS